MDVRSILFCILTVGLLWFQRVCSYVIVNKDRGPFADILPSFGRQEYVESYPEPAAQDLIERENSHVNNLLGLYYLVQVVRSYRRPSYLGLVAIASGLFEQLTREEIRDELASLLAGVDGFEEIFNVGEYPEPDQLKEQLANDFRLLLPLTVKTLGELRDSEVAAIGALQGKLRQTMQDLRSVLSSVVRLESEVLEEIDQQDSDGRATDSEAIDAGEANTDSSKEAKLEETIYETEIPTASQKDVVNDYDLQEEQLTGEPAYVNIIKALSHSSELQTNDAENSRRFLPKESEVVYEVIPSSDVSSQELDDTDSEEVILLDEDVNFVPAMGIEANTPKAVSVKDPEMVALMPVIVEQLREGNVTPEEQQTLAEIFGQLWPVMVAEADRLRTE
uniref:Uncharacterized protein n=1 Tax=Anopheles atroparvus TaxID=41427 RepID=A0A182IKZ7_ANOAO